MVNGAPAKAINGTLSFTHQIAHRLQHVGRVGFRIERSQPVEISGLAERMLHHRPHTRDDVHPEPNGMGGHHYVGVQDGRVHSVTAHGLKGDLGGHLGAGDGL